MTVTLLLRDQLAKLEKQSDKRYAVAELARKVKLSRRITNDLFFGSPEQIRMSTLGKVLDFFYAEGMPVTLEQLFQVEYPKPPVTDTKGDG